MKGGVRKSHREEATRTMPPEQLFRRFRPITDNQQKIDKLIALVEAKNLSRDEIALILTSLSINLDIFLPENLEL